VIGVLGGSDARSSSGPRHPGVCVHGLHDRAVGPAFKLRSDSGGAGCLGFNSNIIFNNEAAEQVAGANCNYTYSDIGPTAASGGAGNINTAPTFVDAGTGDYHLEPTSAGVDAADPAATLATDLDGDARPQGAIRDMGADEVVP